MGGPPLGALALAAFEMHIILAVDVLTAALAIGPLIFILIPQPERVEVEQKSQGLGVWADLQEGLRYLWRWPGLRYLLLIAAALNFFWQHDVDHLTTPDNGPLQWGRYRTGLV